MSQTSCTNIAHKRLGSNLYIVYVLFHCVSNPPPLACYNLDIHHLITIILGKTVSNKVRNQTVLYFTTSPIYCFCTTLRNRKPTNCVFSLKHSILLCQPTRKTFSRSWITLHSQIDRLSTKYIRQLKPTQKGSIGCIASCCLSPAHSVYQVCHGVGRCVKDGSYFSSSLEWKWTDSMNEISYYLNKC